MIETIDMSKLVDGNALNIGSQLAICPKPKRTSVRIPSLCAVEQDIRFGDRGSRMPDDGYGVGTWGPGVSENPVRKSHRVDAISLGRLYTRVEHSAKLNASDYLIPHIECRRRRIIPRSIPVTEDLTRIAKRQLYNWAAQPFWALKHIPRNTSGKECGGANHEDSRKFEACSVAHNSRHFEALR
jgi:hypothetical protein